MACSTPIVFLIFRRPDLTARVFEVIKQVQPKKLLVIADGPNPDKLDEAEKCAAARAIIDRVDWNCEVLKNYSDINLGCKKRVSSGINWAFSEVEEAIILEDDCLPSPSFFNFCEELLERYRYDERIMMISGNNFQQGNARSEYSYYFSKYTHIWGWASWRRAWKYYDVEMSTWSEVRESKLLKSIWEDLYEEKYWTKIFDDVATGLIDTWDYQWAYACWSQSGLSILPNINLVSNIGFGLDATHTDLASSFGNLPTDNIWKIKHPSLVVRNYKADFYTFENHYGGKYIKERSKPLFKLRQKVKSAVNLIHKLAQ